MDGVSSDHGSNIAFIPAFGDFFQASVNTDWITTVTGRIGITGPQWDHLLLYAKGGGAWAQDEATLTNLTTGASFSASRINSGWVAGAGIEWAIAPGWSVRLEYDYIGLNGLSVVDGQPSHGGGAGGGGGGGAGGGVGLPSSDERRAQGVTSSIGTPTVEDSTLGTHRPQRAIRRSNGGPDPSPGLDDSARKCVEAPVGLASEGEHWYYRLDRETHRKCWYVRAFREDRGRRSIVESDRRTPEPTSPDPAIRIELDGTGDDR